MKMDNQMRRIFKGELGQEALKGLERYGVEDLSAYEPWQLKFYIRSPLPWPRCVELFRQYEDYCSVHRFMRFDVWYATVDGNPVRDGGDDFDFSVYDDPSERYTDFSQGEPMNSIIDDNEVIGIDC